LLHTNETYPKEYADFVFGLYDGKVVHSVPPKPDAQLGYRMGYELGKVYERIINTRR